MATQGADGQWGVRVVDNSLLEAINESRGDEASSSGVITIPTTAAIVLAANADRLSVIIQNTSTDKSFFFSYGTGLTVTNGIEVKPGQSVYEDKYYGAIYAVALTSFNVPYIEVRK